MKAKTLFLVLLMLMISRCGDEKDPMVNASSGEAGCTLVDSGFGPDGTTSVHTEAVVTGLVTPWEVAILPGGTDWLVTERPGRLRLVKNGTLVGTAVATVETVGSGEGGLLGLALDPQFQSNSLFYLYFTATPSSGNVNRVQRFKLSADHLTAEPQNIILDNIPWYAVHDGGRIKFGPDGFLYVSTGEGNDPSVPRDSKSPNGKILRITADGSIPGDNPEPGLPWFIKGLRNPQGFDWIDSTHLLVTDNGPTGEYQGRTGGDKVAVLKRGEDLGWPTVWHCESQPGLVSPILTWTTAVPPGGALVYQGGDIPEWKGNVLVASTGGEHLHRIVPGPDGMSTESHEVYFQGELGRLRTVFQGSNGELFITTSNCDSRGTCPSQQDGIYRVRK